MKKIQNEMSPNDDICFYHKHYYIYSLPILNILLNSKLNGLKQ